jgi:hypothetical protein
MNKLKLFQMKRKLIYSGSLLLATVAILVAGCSKILDKQPITQIVAPTDSSNISATDAENLIDGVYAAYKGYDNGLEFNAFDRIVNGDVRSDNCYAGGDNIDNITIDNFNETSLNGNVARDWRDAYVIIGKINIAVSQVERCKDPALSAARKDEILGEAKFIRAYTYFDLVRLYGRVPIILQPANTTDAEALLNSTIVPQSSTDSVYDAVLNDLWFAKSSVRDVSAAPNKFIVSKEAVYSTLAKVYASVSTPNWDSVLYYCNLAIPSYSLVSDYSYLWDNEHKNNSEAIWEINYDGYSAGDFVGNWVPSINVGGSIGNYEGGGWKKFNEPSNDLVNDFLSEGDSIRLNNSITFLNITGQWTDQYWATNHYPFLTKYNDPANGLNDVYIIRLADILLLKAEALAHGNDLSGALKLVNEVRARVKLAPKSSSDANTVLDIIANERRLELAFEGHRWFDLVRTGKAIEVLNAQKDGQGKPLNYNVQPYQLIYPIPQEQIDLNPLLTQNEGF